MVYNGPGTQRGKEMLFVSMWVWGGVGVGMGRTEKEEIGEGERV